MSRALALFTYKLRFFFGPSLRGRFGPFAYLALIAIFLPSAYFTGLGLGMAVRSLDADDALAVLSAPLAAVLCVGLLYSLGAGVTAHPSEFDFFLPADVRPREYLLADLAFQFVTLLVAVGLAAGVAAAYLIGVALVWWPLSNAYVFHGLKPTMSAGFGQMDLGSRMEMQRRMTAVLGRFTTRVGIRTDRGSDTGLMTRYHLVRIWRDGSVVFVIFFALIAVLPAALGGMRTAGAGALTVTQTLTFLLGILAINWAFYERENLWTLVTAAKSPGAYFRGLMLSFAAIGLAMTAGFLALLVVARPSALAVEDLALPIGSPIAAAFVATSILTRIKLKPSALSFAALGIFFLVSLGGFLGGFAAQASVVAVRALGGLDLDIRKGEMVAIMGPSGCGKTTLLNCLSGIDDFTSGEVWIAGQRLSTLGDNAKTDFRAMKMGFIFQNYNLLPVLRTVENVELPLLVRGVDPKAARQRALAAIAAVGLKDVPLKKPAELSGGQQQRIAIARALVNEPDIVFADEPTGNLDSETSQEVVDLMKRLHREKGLTFIIVTHDTSVGNQTQRVIMMRNGGILKSFQPAAAG